MLRKTLTTQHVAPSTNDEIERLTHAVAYVILQRQMRGKWTSQLRPSKVA